LKKRDTHDLDNRPPDEADPALRSKEVCVDLLSEATKHFAESEAGQSDSLYVFLLVHHCVCEFVTEKYEENVVRLNQRFVAISLQRIKTYQAYIRELQSATVPASVPEPGIPKEWRAAFAIYRNNPSNLVDGLPAFARAHIIGDLPEALHLSERSGVHVSKEECDSVLPAIRHCFRKHITGVPLLENIYARLYFFFGQVHFAGRDIKKLRDQAWELADRRSAIDHFYESILGSRRQNDRE
jgi:hypothetical protein